MLDIPVIALENSTLNIHDIMMVLMNSYLLTTSMVCIQAEIVFLYSRI